MAEIWDVYDIDRKKLNKKHERGVRLLEGEYHIVVSAWIRNSEGKIFVQKRHPQKPHPNLWECPGGSILEGESSFKGIIREVEEEIGVNLRDAQGELVKSFRRDQYHDFYDVWLFKKDFSIHDVFLQEEEVVDSKWVTRKDLDKMWKNGELVHTLGYFHDLF